MIRYEHYIDAKTGYIKLYKLLEENRIIAPHTDTPSALRGVVSGAAIQHFAKLSSQKQFEIVAEYLQTRKA